jgi:hypothetical protein
MTRTSLVAGVLLSLFGATFVAAGDEVAAAKAAEQSFHKACDAWETARANGRDTSRAAGDLRQAHEDFMTHVHKTKYMPFSAALVPDQIASAGTLTCADGTTRSYVVGKGQGGVIMSFWARTPWTSDLPNHGFEAVIRLPAEAHQLYDQFSVGPGTWIGDKRDVLRLPYTLGKLAGTIEARLIDGKWQMRPDRGSTILEQPDGSWVRWDPSASPPATRPAA